MFWFFLFFKAIFSFVNFKVNPIVWAQFILIYIYFFAKGVGLEILGDMSPYNVDFFRHSLNQMKKTEQNFFLF